MMTPDRIPLWFALPVAIICTIAYLVLEFRAAPLDTSPDLSRLDVLDGVRDHSG